MKYTATNGNEVTTLGYEDRREDIVKGLRDLAAFIESNPGLTPHHIGVQSYVYSGEGDGDEFKELVRQMGSCEKDASSWSFSVTKKFGNGCVSYELSTPRDNVCTRKVVGTKTREVKDYDAVEVPTKTVTEDVIEWECDPILK